MLGDIAEGGVGFVGKLTNDQGFPGRFSINFNRGKSAVIAEVECADIFEYDGFLAGEISEVGGCAG